MLYLDLVAIAQDRASQTQPIVLPSARASTAPLPEAQNSGPIFSKRDRIYADQLACLLARGMFYSARWASGQAVRSSQPPNLHRTAFPSCTVYPFLGQL